MKKTGLKTLSLLLAVILVLTAAPLGVFAQKTVHEKLPISVISDPHYYPDSLKGDNCPAFQDYCSKSIPQVANADALLDTALDTVKKRAGENGTRYLLVPGDLSKDGEYEANVEFAKKLEEFEKETGIDVFVVNGNHDINNPDAVTFVSGKKEPARQTTPEEFAEIYKNLGYDLADAFYTPESGKQGMLSYAATLDGGYRLIVVDSCKYSSDITKSGEDICEVSACYTESIKRWISEQANEAKENDLVPIIMTHPSTLPHMDAMETFFQEFVLDDWQECADFMADLGIHYTFTGHMHVTDIADYVSDNGNTIYDIATDSLISFPNMFHEVVFDNTGDKLTAHVDTLDVDCEMPVIANGVEYARPYKAAYSFHQTFGDTLSGLAVQACSDMVNDMCRKIVDDGGIIDFLKKNYNIDLDTLLDGVLKGGVKLAGLDIFTAENLMSYLADLDKQIVDNYISDPDKIFEILTNYINKAMAMKISDMPCTTFYDEYGVGDPTKPSNLEDAAYTGLLYVYDDNKDASNDKFMMGVVDGFYNGDTLQRLLTLFVDEFVNYVLEDEILSTLELHINALFPKGRIGHYLFAVLDKIVSLVFKADRSFGNIINTVLGWGVYSKAKDIYSLVHYLLDEYLVSSQIDAYAYYLGTIFEDFVLDNSTDDDNVDLTINDPVMPFATAENYRMPSDITMTVGGNASSSVNISWYTKYSVTGSDIEFYPDLADTAFTGVPTTGKKVTSTYSKVTLTFPGVDLGVFGLLEAKRNMIRHTVTLSGLEAGTRYRYRVGDAKRGWWSDTGVFETADSSESVTFIHVSDQQSQNERQYGVFASLLKSAREIYPNTDFIMSTGDQVDLGTNMNQWQDLLNTASQTLMDIPFMPTSGNHESEGAALSSYFVLPNVPDQNTETGVYYSFDYNNLHVAVLNTNDLNENNELSDAQIQWLKNDIAQSSAEWKIVSLHKAVYSNGSHYDDDDVCALRQQLCSLMPELGIDLVLQGHDHVYLRTDVINRNAVNAAGTTTLTLDGRDYNAKIRPDGTVYVISGCAGIKSFDKNNTFDTDKYFPKAQVTVRTTCPVFSGVRIEGDTLYFDAYEVEDGQAQIIDSFSITHSDRQPDEEEQPSFFARLASLLKDHFNNLLSFFKIK